MIALRRQCLATRQRRLSRGLLFLGRPLRSQRPHALPERHRLVALRLGPEVQLTPAPRDPKKALWLDRQQQQSSAAVVGRGKPGGEGQTPMDERVAPRGVCSHPPACNAELQHRLTDRQCGPPTRHPRRLVRTIRSGAWCSRPPAGPPPASPGGDSASQPGRATHASHPKQHAGVLTPHSNPQYSVQRPHPGLGLELRGRRAQCEQEGCCKLAAADGTRHCVAHGGG